MSALNPPGQIVFQGSANRTEIIKRYWINSLLRHIEQELSSVNIGGTHSLV